MKAPVLAVVCVLLTRLARFAHVIGSAGDVQQQLLVCCWHLLCPVTNGACIRTCLVVSVDAYEPWFSGHVAARQQL